MARYMTQQEKAEFHADFPQMNVQSTLVTGEATPGGPLPLYNCIAHSVGIIDDWFNLAPTVASLNTSTRRLAMCQASTSSRESRSPSGGGAGRTAGRTWCMSASPPLFLIRCGNQNLVEVRRCKLANGFRDPRTQPFMGQAPTYTIGAPIFLLPEEGYCLHYGRSSGSGRAEAASFRQGCDSTGSVRPHGRNVVPSHSSVQRAVQPTASSFSGLWRWGPRPSLPS